MNYINHWNEIIINFMITKLYCRRKMILRVSPGTYKAGKIIVRPSQELSFQGISWLEAS